MAESHLVSDEVAGVLLVLGFGIAAVGTVLGSPVPVVAGLGHALLGAYFRWGR